MNRIGDLVEQVQQRFDAVGVVLLKSTTGTVIASSGECDVTSEWMSVYGNSLPPWPFTSTLNSYDRGETTVVASPAGTPSNHIWLLVVGPGKELVESTDWAEILASLARHALRLQSPS